MNPITTTVPDDGKILLSSDLAGQQVYIFTSQDPKKDVYMQVSKDFFGDESIQVMTPFEEQFEQAQVDAGILDETTFVADEFLNALEESKNE